MATRLEALAEPGRICVSRVVQDQVRDKLVFSFEDMSEQQESACRQRGQVRMYPSSSRSQNAIASSIDFPCWVHCAIILHMISL